MPTDLPSALHLLARLMLGGAFIVFGVRNLMFNVDRLSGVLAAKRLPQPRGIILLGIAIQIVGGAMVATGIFAAWGAAALVAFLMLAAYLFHAFWEFPAAERMPHHTAWLMNTSLSGGFLLVVATSI